MTWKVPSRNLGMPLSQLLRDSQKTFQNDYLDDGKEDGAVGLPLTTQWCATSGHLPNTHVSVDSP